MLRDLGTLGRLARWLGPWTSAQVVPRNVRRRAVTIAPERASDRPFVARFYEPERGRVWGSLLLVPGLHFAGPDDPRMDRFAAILAHAGILVCAPFLPDFSALGVSPALMRDTERAFATLLADNARPPGRAGVFSISFGSLPALRLASSPYAAHVGGLVVFGGYADFEDAMRFCLEGEQGQPHDPLNRPVVFINLHPFLEEMPADPVPLLEAWRAYVRATWGEARNKEPERFVPIAEKIAATLPPADRPLFLEGCGVGEGGIARCRAALAGTGRAFEYLDPRPHLGSLRGPVHIVHGRDDDVIPFSHAALLRDALPPGIEAHTWITGLVSHTESTGLGALATQAPAAIRELRTMVGILRAIRAVADPGGT
jgi:pimeloyl-ACP methyl ester carboxylesterase